MKIEIVSASAGSGKTHRLTGDLLAALLNNGSEGSEGSARRLSVDDWKAELRAIVDKARENGMDAAALARSAAASRGGLSRMLPPVGMAAGDYQSRLLSELQRLVPVLDSAASESKAARDRATAASGALADARRFGLPAWKDQLQLARRRWT